ncbi:hypothetical protein J6590_022890 [Homalodisca vitripennis]|nr:hypothetical protein J6590_022890 [Homalodisca vitripennis]
MYTADNLTEDVLDNTSRDILQERSCEKRKVAISSSSRSDLSGNWLINWNGKLCLMAVKVPQSGGMISRSNCGDVDPSFMLELCHIRSANEFHWNICT